MVAAAGRRATAARWCPPGGRTHARAQRAGHLDGARRAPTTAGRGAGVSSGTGGRAVGVGARGDVGAGGRPTWPSHLRHRPVRRPPAPTPSAANANVAPTTTATATTGVIASRSGERSGHCPDHAVGRGPPVRRPDRHGRRRGRRGLVRPRPVDPVDRHAVDDLGLHRAGAAGTQRHGVGPAVDRRGRRPRRSRPSSACRRWSHRRPAGRAARAGVRRERAGPVPDRAAAAAARARPPWARRPACRARTRAARRRGRPRLPPHHAAPPTSGSGGRRRRRSRRAPAATPATSVRCPRPARSRRTARGSARPSTPAAGTAAPPPTAPR